ncbi:MAG: long-chain fatty acid--CoA ligase, partial [Sulfurovum sp.]
MSYQFNNFYELITFQAKKRRSKVALFVDDEKITYGEILEKVDKLAGFLAQKGVKEGDKIALFLRNSPEFIYTVFAASKLGAIVVPVNTFLKEEELSYILEDSGSSVLVASVIHDKVVNSSKASSLCQFILWEGDELAEGEQHHSFEEALKSDTPAEHTQRTLEDTAVIIYTSGTTGKPKGAMLSHKNIFSNAMSGAMT